jgi:hypothetical protein
MIELVIVGTIIISDINATVSREVYSDHTSGRECERGEEIFSIG